MAARVFTQLTITLADLLELNVSQQWLDSTHVFSHMATFGRVKLMAVAIKRCLTQVKRHVPDDYAALPDELRVRYTQSEGKLFANAKDKKSWADFRTAYETKIDVSDKSPNRTWGAFSTCLFHSVSSTLKTCSTTSVGTVKQAILDTLKVFERVSKPKLVSAITTDMVDQFATKRLAEKGIRGRTLSPATVNKDLRYIRAMMRVAHDWGLVAKVPKLRFLKVAKKLPTFVPPDHFAAIYRACDAATLPNDIPNTTARTGGDGLHDRLAHRATVLAQVDRHRLGQRHGDHTGGSHQQQGKAGRANPVASCCTRSPAKAGRFIRPVSLPVE